MNNVNLQDNQSNCSKINCKANYQAIFICANSKCKKYAFVCQKDECQCQQEHQDCDQILLSKFLKRFSKDKYSLKQIQKWIDDYIRNVIDELSNFKNQLLLDIQQKFQFIGLSEEQTKALKAIQSGQIKGINGQQVCSILSNSNSNEKTDDMKKDIKEEIEESCLQFNSQINKLKENIRSSIEKWKVFYHSSKDLFKFSKIVQSEEQNKCLVAFSNAAIESAKILYRASENGFDAKIFRQKCNGVGNTLTLIETEFNKKLGGFTSVPWKNDDSGQTGDESGKSFLFSLTNNHKFGLVSSQNAIQNQSKGGPIFGNGYDIYIPDNSNENNCYLYVNNSYQNLNYKHGKASWQKLIGGKQNSNFKTKEWEVWQLQFATQQF